MGMFDDLTVECELPDCGYAIPHPHSQWQTKDLHCAMERYVLEADGTLNRCWYEYEDDPSGKTYTVLGMTYPERVVVAQGKLPVTDLHQDVFFYDSFEVEDNGYTLWLEYKARFTEGKLSRIELVEADERPPNPRVTYWNGQPIARRTTASIPPPQEDVPTDDE